MQTRYLEQQPNIIYRFFAFIAHSNIFISICAASATAYSLLLFSDTIRLSTVGITLGTTYILYNTQHLLLRYMSATNAAEKRDWYKKHRLVIWLMLGAGLAEIYPVFHSSWQFIATYCVAGTISLLYFLPFINLRSIPFLKSLIIGWVWTLICVIAPLERPGLKTGEISFAIGQLFFITALCILFNIRDVDQDRRSHTYTIPLLYGIKVAKIFALVLLCGYLAASLYTDPGWKFRLVSGLTFLTSCAFTLGSTPRRHNFYYLLGVDGLILLQSILGFVFLKAL